MGIRLDDVPMGYRGTGIFLGESWQLPPDLKYDFINNPSLTGHIGPDLSFTRATSATMVDADGYIREVQSGEARFDGATFRHNLTHYSESLTNWNQDNTTVVDDADSIAHNGQTISLSEITDDATNSDHSVELTNIYSSNISSQRIRHIVSAYVKAGSSPYVGIAANIFNSVGDIFDTSTGTWSRSSHYAGHGSVNLGNGYYRIYFHIPVGTGGTPAANDLRVFMSDDGTNLTYSGSGDTVLVGGVMVEKDPTDSRTTPSDYIKTPSNSFVTDLSTGTSNGILIEEARTNLLTRSGIGDGTDWSVGSATDETYQTEQAPDGSTNAVSITGDGTVTTTGQVQLQKNPVSIANDGNKYALSIYVRSDAADAHQWFTISQGNHGANNYAQSFDLQNGVLGSASSNLEDSGIEEVDVNGTTWYRCWIVFIQSDADTSGILRLILQDADDVTINSCNPSTAGTVYMSSVQLEQGAFPSSYIPTEGATVTRNAEDVTANIYDYINLDGSGTWFVHHKVNWPAGLSLSNDIGPLRVADGSFAHTICEMTNYNGIRSRSVNWTGDTPSLWTGGNIDRNDTDEFRCAQRQAEDDWGFYVNGITDNSNGFDTSVDVASYSDPVTMGVGQGWATTWVLDGVVKEIRYYREEFPNSVIENMSNGIFP